MVGELVYQYVDDWGCSVGIRNFGDHAANERTLLSWIRSGIAVMAFGFLVEKFTIFLSYIGAALDQQQRFRSSVSAQAVGLALVALGLAAIASATYRYRVRGLTIDAEAMSTAGRSRTAVGLGIGLTLIGIFLFVYLAVGL